MIFSNIAFAKIKSTFMREKWILLLIIKIKIIENIVNFTFIFSLTIFIIMYALE